MLGSDVLDIIIGMLVLFTLLGICVTTLTEAIQSFFQKVRAKHLNEVLQLLLVGKLGTPSTGESDFFQQVLAHPLIASMAPPGKRPSYLEPEVLAGVILDLLRDNESASPMVESANPTVAALGQGIGALQSTHLRQALSTLLTTSQLKATTGENPLLAFKASLEQWIDAAMARAEGRTKRNAKTVSLACSFALCLVLNLNAFDLMKGLIQDEALREAARSTGIKMMMQEGILAAQLDKQCPSDADKAQCHLTTTMDTLQKLPHITLGWKPLPDFLQLEAYSVADAFRWFLDFGYWLLGIVAAAMAASLGGDFWFKLLGQAIRLTGAKTSGEAKP